MPAFVDSGGGGFGRLRCMGGVKRWLLLAGGVLVATGLGWWVVQVTLLNAGERSDASGYGQFVLAAVGLLIVVVGPVTRAFASTATPSLDEQANVLASAMRNQWQQAAVDRRLLEPAPLPIRWSRSTRPVAGPPAAATITGDGRARFEPLPGLVGVTSAHLRSGDRRALHSVYGGLASGRLVIIGTGGSGKSAAAILLLLDALRFRDQAGEQDQRRIPVPVLFTLHGWNPATTPVTDWLVAKLTEIPTFRGRDGARHARSLLKAGRIAVFLDGLDETAEDLRPVALQALSEQTTFRLVLLTRTSELVNAAQQAHLLGAAALELQPVTPTDAADYLNRPLVAPAPAGWQAIADTLIHQPSSPLARALNHPLTITLLRDAYPPTGPVDELLDTARFPTPDDIEDHLLDHALVAAYTSRPGQPAPRYSLDTARRTLGYLAHQLSQDHTRDLAWWRVPRWTSRTAAALVSGLSSWCAVALVFGVLFQSTARMQSALMMGLAAGVTVGIVAGLSAGRRSDTKRRIRTSWWRRLAPGQGVPAGLVAGLAAWFVVSSVHVLTISFLAGPSKSGVLPSITLGWVVAVMVGFGTGLGTSRRDAAPQRTRASWWRNPLPGRSLLVGLPVGLLVGFSAGLDGGVATGVVWGLVVGLGAALAGGLGRSGIDTDAHGPCDTRQQDRAAGLAAALTVWLALVLVSSVGAIDVVHYQLTFGLAICTAVAFTVWLTVTKTWPVLVSQTILALRRRTPWRLMQFLEDARTRHVLRTVGPVYQFRHAKLQDRLAQRHQRSPSPLRATLPPEEAAVRAGRNGSQT
ncbi:hypothetical protein AB0L13_38770 [Saccharopolyspora shandongensis]|uniref:hypothetical protein n=1 Tax=Saccharopolyspora shandongensis TaxID=418495 RepID=UPI0034337D89